jgi:YgiT-type zinc finger domain-containing protein
MNTCLYCKGKLQEQLVTRIQEYNGHWYLIENLPALVCHQCGETYYTPEAHDRVIDLISDHSQPLRIEPMAVLDAS